MGIKLKLAAAAATMMMTTAAAHADAPLAWSDWYDRDNPSGTGDGERVDSYFEAGLIRCENPIAIQARRVSDGLDAELTGEVFRWNNPTTGFVCKNEDQDDGWCDDYEVRYACDQVWGDWHDWDNASGTGDGESVETYVSNGYIDCDDPINVQARRVSDGLFAENTGEVFRYYDTDTGFVCKNEDQDDAWCFDYEARYACLVDTNVWSNWYDWDNASGTGDGERIDTYFSNGYIDCENPIDVQARRKSDGVHADLTGEVFRYYDTETGFVCKNEDQDDGWCDDYEVRYACAVVDTDEVGSVADTGTTVGGAQDTVWSDWFDRDNPSGTGDGETVESYFAAGHIDCEDPTDIQARRKSDGVYAEFTGEVFRTFDTETGFVCKNEDQPDGSWCDDYEVRYACPARSEWVSRDEASGTGDYEGIASHFEAGNFACDTALTFEARRISDGVDASQTGETVTYNTDYGFACLTADQDDGQCDDYEVRIQCSASVPKIEIASVSSLDENFQSAELSGEGMGGVWLGELSNTASVTSEADLRMDLSGRVAIESVPGTNYGTDSTASIVAFMDDPMALGLYGEVGTATVDDGGVVIELSNMYSNPVVFTQVVSQNESDPVIATASIGATSCGRINCGFSNNAQLVLTLHEHSDDDGSHGDETVHYMVVEAGTYTLSDGRTIFVQNVDPGAGSGSHVDNNTQLDLNNDDLGLELIFSTGSTDTDFSVITRLQGADGWAATRSNIIEANSAVSGLDVRFHMDSGVEATGLGVMLIGTDLPGVSLDTSVANECGSGGNTGSDLFTDAGTYGNSDINASHSLQAGVSSTDNVMWAGGKADLSATLFGETATILGLEASASEDNGTFSSRAYLEAMGIVLVDDTIAVNFDWSVSQTFFEASASFYGVTVSGELVGTLGIESSAAVAGAGVTIGATPYADVTASASAGVGAWCLSAGVGADLSIFAVSVPTEATLALSGDDIAWSVESNVEMETLSGSIYLYLDYCIASKEKEIFSWDGIDLPAIELIDASGCF